MYRLRNRGLGAVDIFGQRCSPGDVGFNDPTCPAPQWWMKMWGLKDTSVGVAPAPPVEVWSKPPASGEEAQATVDALLNQQLEAQKAANAEGVKSGWIDEAASEVVAAGESLTSSMPWLLLGAVGLGVFALIAVGGGSARRYGR